MGFGLGKVCPMDGRPCYETVDLPGASYRTVTPTRTLKTEPSQNSFIINTSSQAPPRGLTTRPIPQTQPQVGSVQQQARPVQVVANPPSPNFNSQKWWPPTDQFQQYGTYNGVKIIRAPANEQFLTQMGFKVPPADKIQANDSSKGYGFIEQHVNADGSTKMVYTMPKDAYGKDKPVYEYNLQQGPDNNVTFANSNDQLSSYFGSANKIDLPKINAPAVPPTQQNSPTTTRQFEAQRYLPLGNQTLKELDSIRATQNLGTTSTPAMEFARQQDANSFGPFASGYKANPFITNTGAPLGQEPDAERDRAIDYYSTPNNAATSSASLPPVSTTPVTDPNVNSLGIFNGFVGKDTEWTSSTGGSF